jgi:hypothetical protein
MTLPDNKGESMRKGRLRIICADDCHFSLEALRVIMLNLGVLANSKFVRDGKQAV